MVLYDPLHLRPLLDRVKQLRQSLDDTFDVLALVVGSSPLMPESVSALCESRGLRIKDCRKVNDEYFDFSAYREAISYFSGGDHKAVLFINDTLISKHNSSHLIAAFCSHIRMATEVNFDFPLLIGPYRKSEFSLGDASFDEFVPTFLLYLNAMGVKCFGEMLDEMPIIHGAIKSAQVRAPGIDAALLRFCDVHALQLRNRFRIDGQVDERLSRKLTTAYCERLLSGRIRSAGLIWYVAGGLLGRLLVPAQARLSQLFHGLRM